MTKAYFMFLTAFAAIITLLSVMPAEAYTDCWSNRCSGYVYTVPARSYVTPSATITSGSSYGSMSSYTESPGYQRYPVTSYDDTSRAKTFDSNYDSASTNYDYRGPMFERTSTYNEVFYKDNSGRSGLFYAKNKDVLRHKISSTTTEKYVGATESMYSNAQNRRNAGSDVQQDIHYDRDEGFSYGKQRTFDTEEYAIDSYNERYYYRPNYNPSQGYYDWRY